MLWEDVLVECPVVDTALATSLADVFAIEPKEVLIADPADDALPLLDDGVRVLVERRRLAGDFQLHLSLFLRDADLERAVDGRAATLAALQRLAARLGCAVLTGDESLDPSAWLLVRGSGPIDAVRLDVGRLDNDGFVALLTAGDDLQATAEARA
jgi:hypothetical protein